MIITHQNVDLDAASSVCLWCLIKFDDTDISEVMFVPADYNVDPSPEDIIIDIICGGQGIKGEKSAFSEILKRFGTEKHFLVFKDFADLLDIYDSTGNFPQLVGFSGMTIVDVFKYIKTELVADQEVVENWYRVIRGMYSSFLEYERALDTANKAEKENLIEGIPIIRNAPNGTSSILLSRGYEFVIFEDEFNLGVIRSKTSNKDLGKHLGAMFPEWFHHKTGFLSCWGCRKAPKDSPANISAEKLAELVSIIK
ncbi:MAG TPA: hypothetical protein PKN48_00310 [Bacteroidales bacterium]|nr:hypothetical protein [Bacteroidales bacterium]